MLQQSKSNPIVSSTLTRYLCEWIGGEKCDYARKSNQHDEVHTIIYQAVQEQDTLEWEHVVRGRLNKKQAEAMAMEDTQQGLQHPQTKWVTGLILQNVKRYARNMSNSE